MPQKIRPPGDFNIEITVISFYRRKEEFQATVLTGLFKGFAHFCANVCFLRGKFDIQCVFVVTQLRGCLNAIGAHSPSRLIYVQ